MKRKGECDCLIVFAMIIFMLIAFARSDTRLGEQIRYWLADINDVKTVIAEPNKDK